MRLVYIDDSRDEKICTFSALSISEVAWRESFESLRSFRRALRASDGILVHAEFHAWKFVSGRGHLGPKIVPKGRRCEIFKQTLSLLAQLPTARLFNAVMPKFDDELAFERLMNRLHIGAEKEEDFAILICDEGKEAAYTRLARRLKIHNPIPSKYGSWPGGKSSKNIPASRVLEDPIFKSSRRSYFIQAADFAAYALLRRENPLPSKTKYGLDQAFSLLAPIFELRANTKDKEGIIRK